MTRTDRQGLTDPSGQLDHESSWRGPATQIAGPLDGTRVRHAQWHREKEIHPFRRWVGCSIVIFEDMLRRQWVRRRDITSCIHWDGRIRRGVGFVLSSFRNRSWAAGENYGRLEPRDLWVNGLGRLGSPETYRGILLDPGDPVG